MKISEESEQEILESLIFFIGAMLEDYQIDYVKRFLEADINSPYNIPVKFSIGILTITNPWKEYLGNERLEYYEDCEKHFKKIYGNKKKVKSLLHGLG